MRCIPNDTYAYLFNGKEDANMTLCGMTFDLGGTNKTCGGIGPRVSFAMESVGSVLLHKYVHFGALVVPPLKKGPLDPAYGGYRVHALDKSIAIWNADSFSCFAMENYWSSLQERFWR